MDDLDLGRTQTPLDLGQTARYLSPQQRVFGRYQLIRVLGRGGMGVVWLARDEKLECEVALKFLPELITHDAAILHGLKRETKRSLRLTHHHIVRIYDFAEDGHSACISMEYVDGPTLSAIRVQRPSNVCEVEELKPWIREACEALDYAHQRAKIVHRDLKPANLMVTSGGELKIADFGIARSLTDSVSMLTVAQSTSGTLVYMSPQQLDGERASPLDDIYSLGATIYDLMTGRPPFYSGQIDRQIRERTPLRMSAQRLDLEISSEVPIPEEWEKAVAACLEKDPARRPQSAGELAFNLGLTTSFTPSSLIAPVPRSDPPPVAPPAIVIARPKRRVSILTAVIILLVAFGLAGWWWFVWESPRRQRLASARGEMELETQPAGAAVIIDTQEKGKTPLRLANLPVQKYKVRFTAPGFDAVERRVTVEEDGVANPGVVKLNRSQGALTVASQPSGLSFEARLKETPVAGEPSASQTGTTPATFERLPTGTYEVVVRNEGWPEQRQMVTVEAGQTAATTAEFAPGHVNIGSEPAGAVVWQVDREVGKTPLRLEVRPGTHEFEVKLSGFAPGRVSAAVESKQETAQHVVLQARRYASPDFVLGEFARYKLAEQGIADLPMLRLGLDLALRSNQAAETSRIYYERVLRAAESLTASSFKPAVLTPAATGLAFGELFGLGRLSVEERNRLAAALNTAVEKLPPPQALELCGNAVPGMRKFDRAAAAALQKAALEKLAAAPQLLVQDGVSINSDALVGGLPTEATETFFTTALENARKTANGQRRIEILKKMPAGAYLVDPQRTAAYHEAVLKAAGTGTQEFELTSLTTAAARDGEFSTAEKLGKLVKPTFVLMGDPFVKALMEGKARSALLPARRAHFADNLPLALEELRKTPRTAKLEYSDADKLVTQSVAAGDLAGAIDVVLRADSPSSAFVQVTGALGNRGAADRAETLLTQIVKLPAKTTKASLILDLAEMQIARGDITRAKETAAPISSEEVAAIGGGRLPLLAELGLPGHVAVWESTLEEMRKSLKDNPGKSYALSSFQSLYVGAIWLRSADRLNALDRLGKEHADLLDDYQVSGIVEGAALAGRYDLVRQWRTRVKKPDEATGIRTAANKLMQKHADAEADAFLQSLESDRDRGEFWRGVAEALTQQLRALDEPRTWAMPSVAAPSLPTWIGDRGPAVDPREASETAVKTASFAPGSSRTNAFLREAAVSAARSGNLERAREITTRLAAESSYFEAACKGIFHALITAGRISEADEYLSRIKTPSVRFDAITSLLNTPSISVPEAKIREYLDLAEKVVPSLKNYAQAWFVVSDANSFAQAHAGLAQITAERLHDQDLARRRFQKARSFVDQVPAKDRFFTAGRLGIFMAAAGMYDSARESARRMLTFSNINPMQVGNLWAGIARYQLKNGDASGAMETLRMAEQNIRSGVGKFQDPSGILKVALNESITAPDKAIEKWRKEFDDEKKKEDGLPPDEARKVIADYLEFGDDLLAALTASFSTKAISQETYEAAFFEAFRGLLKHASIEEVADCASRLRLGTDVTPEQLEEAEWDRARANRMVAQRFRKDDRTAEARAWIEQLPSNLDKALAWLGLAEGPPAEGF